MSGEVTVACPNFGPGLSTADGAVATLDAKRKEIYEKAQKILVEDVPVAWLLELQFPTITRCKIKDLITTAIGVNDGFRDAWIDK